MTKRLFFLLGVLAGLLFAGIAIRKKMERLKTLEAEKAEETARFAATSLGSRCPLWFK